MHLRTGLLVFALSLGAPALASAQSLLGLDTGTGALPVPRIHEFLRDCTALAICDSTSLANPIADPAGGIAYGTCTGNVYTTDGFLLVATDLNCNGICRVVIPQIATSGWTGMAVDEDAGRMYFTDAVHVGYYDFRPCQFGNLGDFCRLPAGLNSPLTGVELDPSNGSLWVCDATGQVANLVLGGGQCRVRQIFRVLCQGATAPLSLRGITLDPCARALFVTDDQGTVLTLDTAGNVQNCCRYARVQPARHLVGLARRPAPARLFAQGCSGPGCAPCQPRIGVAGEPVIGSRCFGITLDQAPLGGTAVLMLNLGGPCTQIPIGLCGPLELGIPNFFSPGVAIGGGPGACGGQASFALPIPSNYLLCGLQICGQWIMLCPGGGLGLSDAASIVLN
ncbi:MAG: hypothetical protein IPN34_10845 [Planctomycetes bacterium]|nr:hypothetical protein [Planctomycetota bacterium]